MDALSKLGFLASEWLLKEFNRFISSSYENILALDISESVMGMDGFVAFHSDMKRGNKRMHCK